MYTDTDNAISTYQKVTYGRYKYKLTYGRYKYKLTYGRYKHKLAYGRYKYKNDFVVRHQVSPETVLSFH